MKDNTAPVDGPDLNDLDAADEADSTDIALSNAAANDTTVGVTTTSGEFGITWLKKNWLPQGNVRKHTWTEFVDAIREGVQTVEAPDKDSLPLFAPYAKADERRDGNGLTHLSVAALDWDKLPPELYADLVREVEKLDCQVMLYTSPSDGTSLCEDCETAKRNPEQGPCGIPCNVCGEPRPDIRKCRLIFGLESQMPVAFLAPFQAFWSKALAGAEIDRRPAAQAYYYGRVAGTPEREFYARQGEPLPWSQMNLVAHLPKSSPANATQDTSGATVSTQGLTELAADEFEKVVAAITSDYPAKGSRHDYRWRWRCVMARWGVGVELALDLINAASERAGAEKRALRQEYETDLEQLAAGVQKYGIPALLELVEAETFDRVAAILDPEKRKAAWVAMSPKRLAARIAGSASPRRESNVFTSKGDRGQDLVHVEDTSFQGIATKFLDLHYPNGDLRKWRGGWYRWEGTHYEELDPEELEIQVGKFVSNVMLPGPAKKPAVPMQDNAYNISMVTKALIRAPRQVHISAKQEPDPKLRALANGVLDVRTGELLPHDPSRLVFSAAAWSWAPDTPTPEWDKFLASLELDDVTVQCLQEAMGYLVYGDDSFQKLVTLIGEKRSGKGTIAGVVAKLVGRAATVVLSDYGRDFKLAGAIGADVLIDYDQRAIGLQSDQDVIAQRLLNVSAHEPVVIDCKYGKVWTGTLGKVLVCSNKVPAIKDSGGALAHRWVIVSGFHKSFLGREDKTLGERLVGELPGIAAWVLEGWRRVRERGDFIEATKAAETRELMKSGGSLSELFVSEMCETGAGKEVARQTLYDAFAQWCQQQGERNIPTMRVFGAELHAANISGFRWSYRPRSTEDPSRGRVVQGISLLR